MAARAIIFGCEGPILSQIEKDFFENANPWGFILFARNLEAPEQIRRLCADLRESVGRDAPILIDQEGGRVQRLRSPEWREWLPPLDQFDAIDDANMRRQAMVLRHRLIAHELIGLGIDVNCAPMLDVPQSNAHEIIMNRCFSRNANDIAELGRAASEGLLAGGVLPIIKHIPGHGRADLDSHHDLPVVGVPRSDLDAVDFLPFSRLADLPMAMTAHIVYPAIDPENCATLSPSVINVIRKDIGFDGLLMTDDLSMKALKGTFADRVTGAMAAGCDMSLHCNGVMNEMTQVIGATPELTGNAAARADAALSMRHAPHPFDPVEADAVFLDLLKGAVHA
jgi:beta-N-acetylhexosaminidase